MKFSPREALPSLMIAFALAGCGENAAEKAMKPGIIDDFVKNAVSLCETGPANDSRSAYRDRLEAALQDADAADLKTLQDRGITICLDQRLGSQKDSFWNKRIDAVFYPQGGGGTLALWDDGRPPSDAGFWSLDAADHADEAIEKLADILRDGDAPKDGSLMYAARYTYSTGKSSYTTTKWRAAEDFDEDSIRENPAL